MYGRNDNSILDSRVSGGIGQALSFSGGFAQADYHLRDEVVLTLRGNVVSRPPGASPLAHQTFASLFPGLQVFVRERLKLSFEYGTTRNVTRQAIQALVANDLKQIGVDAQVVNYPRGFFAPDGPRNTGQTKLAEFAYTQLSTSNFDNWDATQVVTEEQPGNPNSMQYKNDLVTHANQIFKAELDRKKQAEQSAIIQAEMTRDAALIPLVERPIIEIYSNKMVNRRTTNSSYATWWNLTQYYFK